MKVPVWLWWLLSVAAVMVIATGYWSIIVLVKDLVVPLDLYPETFWSLAIWQLIVTGSLTGIISIGVGVIILQRRNR